MKKPPKVQKPLYQFYNNLTNVSSGTSIVIDTSALKPIYTADNYLRHTQIDIVGVGSVGSAIIGKLADLPQGVQPMWQIRTGGASQLNFYDPDGNAQKGDFQEYEIYVTEEEAEGHADLRVMRHQFLEDLEERGMTEQEYLKLMENTYTPSELEAPKLETPQPEVSHGERMLEFSSILFSRRARELVVEPIIADYKKDVQEALAAGASKWKLRAIQTRYWIAYIVGFLDEVLPVVGRLWRALGGP